MRERGDLVTTGECVNGLGCCDENGRVDANDVGLSFTGELGAGTDPNDLTTFSYLIAGAIAGDEDVDSSTSSIEPKITVEPETSRLSKNLETKTKTRLALQPRTFY